MCVDEVCESIFVVLFFIAKGTKLQWSYAITIAIFIGLFTAFWAAMPLIGWGEYDYEPLRTCCTLDMSKGDRYSMRHSPLAQSFNPHANTNTFNWTSHIWINNIYYMMIVLGKLVCEIQY